VEISDAEIDEFYNKNIERFTHEEEVKRATFWSKWSPAPLRRKGRGPRQGGRAAQADQDGADFAELAKAVSDDPGTKNNGGDLNWFGRGKMVPPSTTQAFSLQPGELSRWETNFGFHIIKSRG
jgi:peptidyl-prolyl cis-trans isomerase D